MEATIFVLSSLATNLAGIYWHVPFTVVDPQHSFLERLVGSVQVSSTIYTLRYWHPLVFPEAAKCESLCESCESCESPAQNASMELGDVLKNVMDQYVQKQQNLTVPCLTNIGNSCSDQPPPLTTIHHTLFGRTFDIPLDQNSADLYWTVFFTALVLIAIILVLCKGFTQGSRKHDTDATSGQKPDKSADFPSEKEALDWICIARFAVALGIKDDISHDSVNIRAKITDIPENLRQFQRILESDSMGAECKEGDDVESDKKSLAQVFDGHLRFCTEAVKSALEALNQLSRRVDHRINLHEQPLDGYGHGQGDQKVEDSAEEFDLYQHKFLTKNTLEATTSAMEKRILGTVDDQISALDEETKKRIDNIESVLANISALHEEAKREIDNIESALAKVQQSLSVGVVDQEQLNEIIGGLKADIENLRTPLQSLSREGNDSQVGVDTIVHEQLQSLEKRVRALEHADFLTPLSKEQIRKELDELDQAVLELKASHAEIESNLNSTVETQVKEALKEITANLEQQTEGMKNQLQWLKKALDEVKNAAVESKNNDPELGKEFEDIERAIHDSTKEVQSFRKELDSHALEQHSLREAVNRALKWNQELEDGIARKITNVVKNIKETNDRVWTANNAMHMLEEYKWYQRNMTLSIWGHLDKCMDALNIKYDPSAADLVTIHDRDEDPVEKPESNDEDLAAEHGAQKTGADVVDEASSQKEAQAAGLEAQLPKEEAQPPKDEAGAPKSEAQIDEQAQAFDDQRPASAQFEAISPRTSKPASEAISGSEQSPVAGLGDEAAKPDAESASAGLRESLRESRWAVSTPTQAQPKTSPQTPPQTPGFAKGKSSGKLNPNALHFEPETSTSARHEKSQGTGLASAPSPSKPSTEPASTETSKSIGADSTPTQAQPKTSEGTQSSQTPGSAKGKSSGKHTPRTPHLEPETSTSSTKPEKNKGAGAASAQAPSKPSAEISKSKWAKSTPAQAQPAKTPTHAGAEGDESDSPDSAQAPPKPFAEISKSKWAPSTTTQAESKTPTHAGVEGNKLAGPASAQAPSKPSAEISKSKWAPSTTTQAQSKTPTPAGVEGGKLASPASAQAPSKPDTPASAELSKSKLADFFQKASPAQAPPKLYAPASAGVGESRWADPALAKTQPKTPAHAGSERGQLAGPASAKAPSKPTSAEMSKSKWASPASAEDPSKLAAPASAGLTKSSWADESSPTTAQRRKSVSLPSKRNKEGDIGETY
ncbi:hypothetical protein CNMCM6106_002496 [Aspergillus hiratsukae]|uniref:Uncharacterized protein n=1 Tax=Aspergillus hiratsukae TaxID=1194566 RepID=A0A8H6UTW4_9EURO|nr:hypothetical protein CNMCM6106_002496 [Aspergillus hiratsukae]